VGGSKRVNSVATSGQAIRKLSRLAPRSSKAPPLRCQIPRTSEPRHIPTLPLFSTTLPEALGYTSSQPTGPSAPASLPLPRALSAYTKVSYGQIVEEIHALEAEYPDLLEVRGLVVGVCAPQSP
jgi:hypothetical protein